MTVENKAMPDCSIAKSFENQDGVNGMGNPVESSGVGITTSQQPGMGAPGATSPEQEGTASYRLAALLAGRNRVRDALEALQPLLTQQPRHVPGLTLQGRCLATLGSKAEAMAAFASALSVHPNHIPALLGCAAVYKETGLLHEALALLEQAHTHSPTDSDVTQALALILTDIGTSMKLEAKAGWLESYQRAVEVCPGYAPAHYNLGVAAADQGDAATALQCYNKAIELHPRYAEALCNLGAIYKGQGDLDKAVALYARALEIAPTLDLIQTNLATAITEQGTVFKSKGAIEGAIKAYERALAIKPRHAEALYNLGVMFTEQGSFDKAVFMYETAIAVAPTCAEAHNNLGVLFRELGNGERAMQCYKASLDVRPTFTQALSNLAVMYTQQGRAQEALGLLQAAIMANSQYAEAHNNLGVLQRDIGDVVAAINSYERCLAIDPDNRNAGQNKLLALNYVHHGEEEVVCEAHAEWGRQFEKLHPRLPPVNRSERQKFIGDGPLVVGYVTPDLFTHSVSYFAEAPMSHHNPQRVHHIVYSCCPIGDAKTERIRAAVEAAGGTWKDVARLSEADLAEEMRQDGLDVLVELTGHTANNRLGAVARHPAPVQVTWIGYPNSTGLSTVQHRITDAVCDPEDTKQTFTEELIRLPGCFLCYTPSVDAPPVAPLPASENGFITFGSFNALAKETPEVLEVWARILRSVPNSRLVLKNKPFACESVRCQYWRQFEEFGVDRHRVDLVPLVAATGDHLSQYSMLDISLDPWPYAGTTTTTESLYMGVPCLTLAGACHAHNVGKSLLTAIGLQDDWVAHSVEDYIDKAVTLASNVNGLAGLRQGLRERMVKSPLCDAPKFVSELEDVYWELWNRWQQAGNVE